MRLGDAQPIVAHGNIDPAGLGRSYRDRNFAALAPLKGV